MSFPVLLLEVELHTKKNVESIPSEKAHLIYPAGVASSLEASR